MSPKTLSKFGILTGFLLIFLASTEFIHSFQSGNPKWYYLVMITGMGLILYYTIFKKRR